MRRRIVISLALTLICSTAVSARPGVAWWRNPVRQWPALDYFVSVIPGKDFLPIRIYADFLDQHGWRCGGDRSPDGAIYAAIICTSSGSGGPIKIVFHHEAPKRFVPDSVAVGDRKLTQQEIIHFFQACEDDILRELAR